MPIFIRRLTRERSDDGEHEAWTLYRRMACERLGEDQAKAYLKRIGSKGLNSAARRLSSIGGVEAKLTLHVSTRWSEAVACFAYGLYNAAIAVAAMTCEVQLREQLGGSRRRGTYGQLVQSARDSGKFAPEILNLHDKMAKYRNPYVHLDIMKLAEKHTITVGRPPDFVPRTQLPNKENPLDMIAVRMQQDRPVTSASDCMKLAQQILQYPVQSQD